jgi:phage tail sheath protein FI
MPVTPTYPGVYVEEIPSGVRTITGVATSITAFVGKAVRGPVNQAVTITSFGDFERIFGGVSRSMTLGYAVRDFFVNGGSQAIIVRLYTAPAGSAARATYPVPDLTLQARSEGAWGMQVRARVDKKAATDPNLIAVAQRLGVLPADVFDLTLRDAGTGSIETFLNLTS